MSSHLARCADCRLEAERLLASVVSPADRETRDERALESVLESARQWESERAATDPDDRQVKTQAAGTIAAYLGGKAADKIVERVSPKSEDLLPQIESVLALFLGGKAAAELTGHVVDGMIVRP